MSSIQTDDFQARDLLDELSRTHREVVQCMAEMDRTTSGGADKLVYTRARYAISRASLIRRNLFREACRELSQRVEPVMLDRIREAEDADKELMRLSAAHVSRWTAEQVEVHWPGYVTASKAIRAHMKHELDTEKRIIFPLLQRLAADQQRMRPAA